MIVWLIMIYLRKDFYPHKRFSVQDVDINSLTLKTALKQFLRIWYHCFYLL